MTCKIARFNAQRFPLLGIQKGQSIPHMSHLFAKSEKQIISSVEGITPNVFDIAVRAFKYVIDSVQATTVAEVTLK
jgi:hypothetical protein